MNTNLETIIRSWIENGTKLEEMNSLQKIVQGTLAPQKDEHEPLEVRIKRLLEKWEEEKNKLKNKEISIQDLGKTKDELINKLRKETGIAPLSNSKLRKFYQLIIRTNTRKNIKEKTRQLLYLKVYASYEAGREKKNNNIPIEIKLFLDIVNQSVEKTYKLVEKEQEMKKQEQYLVNFQNFWEAVLAFHREVEEVRSNMSQKINKEFKQLKKAEED